MNTNKSKPSADKEKSSKPHANQRGAARLAAVQALYQMDIGGTELGSILEQFDTRRAGGEVEGEEYLPADVDFLRQIVSGVLKNQLEIDPLLNQKLSDEWHLTKIDSTLRAILRAGAFELLYKRDIPAKVVINEYLDVAQAFFEGEVPAMVNAVLDKISKELPKN
ncbi:MAG: transcription antitermination factor NusB [Devosiaceae bacterium]|nr:transcription antitermination factor NusB [Devosiaceae bacterium]